MKKEIFIYRHGETDLNKEGIIQGSGVDAGLNEQGRLQARAFYEHYRSLDFEVVLTSQLRRTHQTAEPFILDGVPWEQTEYLNEIHWGVHEGKKSTPEMEAAYRTMVQEWGSGNFDARLEGGESAADLAKRLQSFISDLERRPERRVLVCTHGRAMRCLMCLLQGQHLREMEHYRHANTGLYRVLQHQGQYRIEQANDTTHLMKIER